MSVEDEAAKFDALAGPVIGRARSERLFRMIVEDLDSMDNIGEMIALMVP